MRSEVNHLLPTGHVYMDVWITYLASKCLTFFFYLTCTYWTYSPTEMQLETAFCSELSPNSWSEACHSYVKKRCLKKQVSTNHNKWPAESWQGHCLSRLGFPSFLLSPFQIKACTVPQIRLWFLPHFFPTLLVINRPIIC
jgi:hypothetical protein